MQTMPLTQHDKNEFSRMANAAYKKGYNFTGNRFSVLSALPNNSSLPTAVFDTVMNQYRAWLCFDRYPEPMEGV